MSAKVLMELSVLEAAHLTALVVQFADLLAETVDEEAVRDPAIARLVPDAYDEEDDASAEFLGLTLADMFDCCGDYAARVLTSLERDGVRLSPDEIDRVDAETPLVIELDAHGIAAWLRTLTAVRLVMATRLGILDEDDDDGDDDPRRGVYNWLGFRLEGLLQALED